jgi:predicted dithiol-disulfide oxidoreductase (DUF899 family)
MATTTALIEAHQLAAANKAHFPNESPAYRASRNTLLAEEIELRRSIERVAALRRSLPPGGEVPAGILFEGQHGPVPFADLFGDKQSLVVYSAMYGPQRPRPCPVCTSMLAAWDGTARNLRDRVALAVTARSPIGRLLDYKKERGFRFLPFYSDTQGDYTRAYVSAEDADMPALNIFTRDLGPSSKHGIIRHFWATEMGPSTADPGQDPRGAPDIDPLWTILDLIPEGRGATWYPTLDDPPAPLTQLK